MPLAMAAGSGDSSRRQPPFEANSAKLPPGVHTQGRRKRRLSTTGRPKPSLREGTTVKRQAA